MRIESAPAPPSATEEELAAANAWQEANYILDDESTESRRTVRETINLKLLCQLKCSRFSTGTDSVPTLCRTCRSAILPLMY